MSISATIEQHEGMFVASLLGKPEISVQRDTREAAIDALYGKVRASVEKGEIISIELAQGGAGSIAGGGTDDPLIGGVVEEVYAERDRQREAWIREIDG